MDVIWNDNLWHLVEVFVVVGLKLEDDSIPNVKIIIFVAYGTNSLISHAEVICTISAKNMTLSKTNGLV